MRQRCYYVLTLAVTALAVPALSAQAWGGYGWGAGYGNGWYGDAYGWRGGDGIWPLAVSWNRYSYGYYPGYYGYGTPGYASAPSGYAPGYTSAPSGNYTSYYAAAPSGEVLPSPYPGAAPDVGTARIGARVPTNARVFVNGEQTTQNGQFRRFVSPPLDPGQDYTYEIRATWDENGHQVDRTSTVSVRAGQLTQLDFMAMGTDTDRDRRNELKPARMELKK